MASSHPIPLRLRRYLATLQAIERWEAKERRARTALRKLRKRQAYYVKLMTADRPANDRAAADRKASAKHNRIAIKSMKAREVALAHLPRTAAKIPRAVSELLKEAP